MTAVIVDIAEERFRRDVERLHALGPRALLELLAELGRERLIRTRIECLVARYATIEAATLALVGADRFPPASDEIEGER